ncbi:MAG TPA: peptide-methionine (S)-S-oxide reductase MsrA [Bacteroidia bacterium]|nr:peptide-methionine (S)-S-oxide reductase MsrA [Bacteroidia bacterium]
MIIKCKYLIAVNFFTAIFFSAACNQAKNQTSENSIMETKNTNEINTTGIDTITFGAGCFWCVEAVFQRLEGVTSVKSGYIGGKIKNPTYREVCSGLTDHAEVCQITYDPSKLKIKDLLEVFFKTHDPTTLNRQGADAGTQYRSAIFYHTPEQKEISEKVKEELNKSGAYPNPIVTEITAASAFYIAEDYHQNYFNLNGKEPYCQYVIQPKLEKFEKVFKDKMKKP